MLGLRELADFRYRLRGFLSFSELCAEQAGLTAQQYQLLQVIASSKPDEISITRVAERMLLRHNSAVELVDRAVKSGLVRRVQDLADHRRSLVQLTEKGRSLLGSLLAEHLRYLHKAGPALVEALVAASSAGAETVVGER